MLRSVALRKVESIWQSIGGEAEAVYDEADGRTED